MTDPRKRRDRPRSAPVVRRSTVRLPGDVAARVRMGHPWVYREALGGRPLRERRGAVVELLDPGGAFVGRGFYEADTPIAVRVVTRERGEVVGPELVARRVREAAAVRRQFVPADVDAYRVVNAESDGLPGLAVDAYAGFLVVHAVRAGGPARASRRARRRAGAEGDLRAAAAAPARRRGAARPGGARARRPGAGGDRGARGAAALLGRRDRAAVDRPVPRPARGPARRRLLGARPPRAQPVLLRRRAVGVGPARRRHRGGRRRRLRQGPRAGAPELRPERLRPRAARARRRRRRQGARPA